MIVRISGEDQYRLDDGDRPGLNELEAKVVEIVDGGDEDGFSEAFSKLLDYVREHGEPVAADDLAASDVILPPADTSFEEARGDFTGEGLIPD
jgi:hypothetical protein